MALAQSTYLTDEAAPWTYDTAKADHLRIYLKQILTTLAEQAPSLAAPNDQFPPQPTRHLPAHSTEIAAKGWLTEAPMRLLMNNLHPDVAENPHELVVWGGIGRAARTWQDFDAIVAELKDLEDTQTLMVQSGKPVGVFNTHKDALRDQGR